MESVDYEVLMPTAEERLTLIEAGKIAYEKGGFPEKAMALVRNIDHIRLAVDIMDHVKNYTHDRTESMRRVVMAAFFDSPVLIEAIKKQSDDYEKIANLLCDIEKNAQADGVFDAFCRLTVGCDAQIWINSTGVTTREGQSTLYVNGRLAQQRMALAVQIEDRMTILRSPIPFWYIKSLLKEKAQQERANNVGRGDHAYS